jgi:hypothetical protein
VSARCIAVRNALVAAINGADILPSGVDAVGKLFEALRTEDLDAMQVSVVPLETAIERVGREEMQHDETLAVVMQVKADPDNASEVEAALLVYANVVDLLAGSASVLLGGEYVLTDIERAAHYDTKLLTDNGIVRTIVKATYRSIA